MIGPGQGECLIELKIWNRGWTWELEPWRKARGKKSELEHQLLDPILGDGGNGKCKESVSGFGAMLHGYGEPNPRCSRGSYRDPCRPSA